MDSSSSSSDDDSNLINALVSELTNSDDEKMMRMFFSGQLEGAGSSSTRPRKKRAHIERGREMGHERLVQDYFSDEPTYGPRIFRRRFRMHRHVFLRIVHALESKYTYFTHRNDAVGKQGLSPLQKCTAAIRMLAYGVSADYVDEYVRLGETTATECLKKFVRGINEVFGEEYLRQPNVDDIARLLQIGEQRGFPGMLGSIDCMHWPWKNCPVAWKGQFTRGDHGFPTIMLEAVASADLWIWHAYFGVAGSNNDINVLNQSHLFTDVLQNSRPHVQFVVNSTPYTLGYYLADGIYPEWPTFVKTIPLPQGAKRKLFAQFQESVRKDVERAFGVLQSRFAIVKGPGRFWHRDVLRDIMYACIILHNMIVEDERGSYDMDFNYDVPSGTQNFEVSVSQGPTPTFADILRTNVRIHDRASHRNLQSDLVEHIWARFGRGPT